MSFFAQIGTTLVSWFALMFVSTNLIGLFVRGFVANRELAELGAVSEIIAQDRRRSELVMNTVASILIIVFIAILYHFWNFGMVFAGTILMISRVPDLIWEIKKGRKLEMKDMRKPMFFKLTTLLTWTSLPVVWYSIYQI